MSNPKGSPLPFGPPSPGIEIGEVLMIAIPVATFKAVSDVAAKRGMTFAQFLGKALDAYIKKTEATEPSTSGPRLLTEQE